MFSPPEFIIEDTQFGGKRCVIFDPVSSGEYFDSLTHYIENS